MFHNTPLCGTFGRYLSPNGRDDGICRIIEECDKEMPLDATMYRVAFVSPRGYRRDEKIPIDLAVTLRILGTGIIRANQFRKDL